MNATTETLATGQLVTLAEFTDYADAQRTVDTLSDNDFPVGTMRIVGHDLKSMELVTGRMSKGKAAGLGAGGGAWFGLLISLLLGLFLPAPAWLGMVLAGVVMGALFGAGLGFVGHWATRGQRDFTSESTLVATTYDVLVAEENLLQARSILGLTS